MFRFKTLAALALVALIAAPALAADTQNFRVINNSGAIASDLHVTFSGTVSNISAAMLVNPDACGVPAITYTGGNTVNLDWGVDCVPIGQVVIMRVTTTDAGPLAITSGEWTYTSGSPVAISVVADTASIAVPTVSQWGLIVMTLALLTAATIIFARRRPATAHA